MLCDTIIVRYCTYTHVRYCLKKNRDQTVTDIIIST